MKTLLQFAKAANVKFSRCEAGWGGTWAFSCSENSMYCGYQTKREAAQAWADETFGKDTAKALVKLLDQVAKAQPKSLGFSLKQSQKVQNENTDGTD